MTTRTIPVKRKRQL